MSYPRLSATRRISRWSTHDEGLVTPFTPNRQRGRLLNPCGHLHLIEIVLAQVDRASVLTGAPGRDWA